MGQRRSRGLEAIAKLVTSSQRADLDALGGDVVEMPCRWLEDEDRAVPHAFHRDCALELLNASASRGERVPRCPTCRDDFPPHLLVAHPEDL